MTADTWCVRMQVHSIPFWYPVSIRRLFGKVLRMEQDESVGPEVGSVVPGQREVVSVTADAADLSETSTEGLSFGPLANPRRLRLGVSPSL